MAVYQTDHYGSQFTYTFPALTPGATYIVRLHFAEIYWTLAGQRQFNVAINGTQVLQNFDIIATACGSSTATGCGTNTAVVQSFTATANNAGQIAVAFTGGNADLPQANGLEIIATGNATMPPPVAATGLMATPGNGQVALTWIPGNGPSGKYTVLRGTTPGGETTTITPTVGIDTPYFIDTTATNLTTYYYVVQTTNKGGASGPSNEVVAEPGVQVTGIAIYKINAGGDAIEGYSADEFSTGGGQAGSGNTINTAAVVNPAPPVVYQTEHDGGTFSYVFPNLTPGANYLVRLHFAETYFNAVGQRVFNVAINNTPVLENFDIIETSGAQNTAVVEQFTAIADANGEITVTYTAGTADQPKASALEVYPQ